MNRKRLEDAPMQFAGEPAAPEEEPEISVDKLAIPLWMRAVLKKASLYTARRIAEQKPEVILIILSGTGTGMSGYEARRNYLMLQRALLDHKILMKAPPKQRWPENEVDPDLN